MFTLIFVILGPISIGALSGWRGGYDAPTSPMEFLKSCGFAIAWAMVLIFTWHALWLFSASGARIIVDAAVWTLFTAALWLPVLVILYILRAQRRLRE